MKISQFIFFFLFNFSFTILHTREVYIYNPSIPVTSPEDVQIILNTEEIYTEIDNCNDIHFWYIIGGTYLPFLREGFCNDQETVFWITLPNIPSGNNLLIEIRYGEGLTSDEIIYNGVFFINKNSGTCPMGTNDCAGDECGVSYYVRGTTTGFVQQTRVPSYSHTHDLTSGGYSLGPGKSICDQGWIPGIGNKGSAYDHTHGNMPQGITDASDLIPAYYNLLFCESKHMKLIVDQVIMYDSMVTRNLDMLIEAIPNIEDKFIRSTSSAPGSYGGSNTHTHLFNSWKSGFDLSEEADVYDVGGVDREMARRDHKHWVNGYLNSQGESDHRPEYIEMIFGRNTQERIPLKDQLFFAKGSIPQKGYISVAAPNNKFFSASTSYGNTDGSNNNDHSHAFDLDSGGAIEEVETAYDAWDPPDDAYLCDAYHEHRISGISTAFSLVSGNVPSYFTAIVMKRKPSLIATVNDEVCDSVHKGVLCENPKCYSYFADDGLTCSGNGDCNDVDLCENCGIYSGDSCQCLATKCKNGGKCEDEENFCTCQTGFHGIDCQCASGLCNDKGFCLGLDTTCTCNTGFNGDLCQCTDSFCNNFGECVEDTLVCACDEDHGGTFCEVPKCYTFLATDNSSCSGHGTCDAVDVCICDDGFSLPICTEISTYCDPDCIKDQGFCNYFTGKCDCITQYYGDYCQHFNSTDDSFNEMYLYIGIGGGIGLLVLMLLVLGLFILCALKKKNKKQQRERISKDGFAELESFDDNSPQFKVNLKLFLIPMKDLKLIKECGHGGSQSVVYECDWKGKRAAFKVFRSTMFTSQKNFEEFEKEVSIMSSINHPNISKYSNPLNININDVVQFFGASVEQPRIGLVLEFCKNGDMMNYFTKNQNSVTFTKKLDIMGGIIAGLEYMHQRKLIHRDIKSSNVLLTDTLQPKLIDFGLSRVFTKQEEKMTVRVGTKYYMAPEVFLGNKYSEKADIFSASIVLFEVYNEMFDDIYGKTDDNVELKVSQNPNFRPKFKGNVPNWFKELLQSMWNHNPRERPSASEVKKVIITFKDKKNVQRPAPQRQQRQRPNSNRKMPQRPRSRPGY